MRIFRHFRRKLCVSACVERWAAIARGFPARVDTAGRGQAMFVNQINWFVCSVTKLLLPTSEIFGGPSSLSFSARPAIPPKLVVGLAALPSACERAIFIPTFIAPVNQSSTASCQALAGSGLQSCYTGTRRPKTQATGRCGRRPSVHASRTRTSGSCHASRLKVQSSATN